ncbi:MAG TPA: YtxH domain-containing protein [Bryobacteraceae bacterium]|nr:YtxH domain-containing protein [Bryobacteraceae bacterium]
MKKDYLIGLSLGLGVGAALGLLLAPRSGEKTQKLIARKIRKSTDYFQDQASGLRDSATDLLEKGKEQIARHRQGIERAYKQAMA